MRFVLFLVLILILRPDILFIGGESSGEFVIAIVIDIKHQLAKGWPPRSRLFWNRAPFPILSDPPFLFIKYCVIYYNGNP